MENRTDIERTVKIEQRYLVRFFFCKFTEVRIDTMSEKKVSQAAMITALRGVIRTTEKMIKLYPHEQNRYQDRIRLTNKIIERYKNELKGGA
jgi:hypothetical protein